jgi:hypothetical protein
MDISLLHLEKVLDSITCIGTHYLDSGNGLPCEIFPVEEFNQLEKGVRFDLVWQMQGVCVTQSIFIPTKKMADVSSEIDSIVQLPFFKRTFALFTHGVVDTQNIDRWSFSHEHRKNNANGTDPTSVELKFFVVSNEKFYLGSTINSLPCVIKPKYKGFLPIHNGAVFELAWRNGDRVVKQSVFNPCSDCSKERLNSLFQQPNFKNVFALFTNGVVDAPQNWEMTTQIGTPITEESDPDTHDLVFKVRMH